jgi:hypothetical protein
VQHVRPRELTARAVAPALERAACVHAAGVTRAERDGDPVGLRADPRGRQARSALGQATTPAAALRLGPANG